MVYLGPKKPTYKGRLFAVKVRFRGDFGSFGVWAFGVRGHGGVGSCNNYPKSIPSSRFEGFCVGSIKGNSGVCLEVELCARSQPGLSRAQTRNPKP